MMFAFFMAAGWLVVWDGRQSVGVLFCRFHTFDWVVRLCVMLFEFSMFASLSCWLLGRTEARRLSHVFEP